MKKAIFLLLSISLLTACGESKKSKQAEIDRQREILSEQFDKAEEALQKCMEINKTESLEQIKTFCGKESEEHNRLLAELMKLGLEEWKNNL